MHVHVPRRTAGLFHRARRSSTLGWLVKQDTWNRSDVVDTYAARKYITPAEVRVLATCWPKIAGGTVLDIGVGAGRTIPYLAPFAARYVAIDYMPNMVAQAKRAHPGLDIREADARALPFADGEFSFVLFSFNGIDYVEPHDRPRILAEVKRVLAPGGAFAYSTHNLASRGNSKGFAISSPSIHAAAPLRSAISVVRNLTESARGYRNYRRLAKQERDDGDIAFIVDGAHEYSVLTCYVTQAHERRALADAGFAIQAVIELDGRDAPRTSNSRDFYFVVEALQ
jgi:SAM-dependent methyltransferase